MNLIKEISKLRIELCLFVLLTLMSCQVDPLTQERQLLADTMATAETISLYKNLQNISKTGTLFGHQDSSAYGVGWSDGIDRSDIKSVSGSYPAVFGWDLGGIETEANLDGINFEEMKELIKQAHNLGAVNTISMHLNNPVTGGNAWDNSNGVTQILPGGSHHSSYLETLDLIALFIGDLHDESGRPIPIILRPYHEHNHSWSWWGRNVTSSSEFIELWRMTVKYFRDDKNLHNLIYAYSPQDVTTLEDYLEGYPGDDYVDIFALDCYSLWTNELGQSLEMIAILAESRGKIATLSEVGQENVTSDNWWTNYLLEAIEYSDQSQHIAWTLVWRNASETHHWGPYPGHGSAADFLEFYNSPETIFLDDLPNLFTSN